MRRKKNKEENYIFFIIRLTLKVKKENDMWDSQNITFGSRNELI